MFGGRALPGPDGKLTCSAPLDFLAGFGRRVGVRGGEDKGEKMGKMKDRWGEGTEKGRDEARREIGERTGKGSGYDNSPMLAGLHFTRWNIRTSAFYPRPFANCKPRTRVQIFYPCRFQQMSNHLIISFQTFYIDRNVRPHPLAILRRKLTDTVFEGQGRLAHTETQKNKETSACRTSHAMRVCLNTADQYKTTADHVKIM